MYAYLRTRETANKAVQLPQPNLQFSLCAPRFYSRTRDRMLFGSNVYACAYNFISNEGRYLAVGCEKGGVTVLDTDPNTEQDSFIADKWVSHRNNILDICWTPDDRFIVTASGDRTCKLWDVEQRKCVSVLGYHRASVKSVTFNPHDPNTFATASRDGTISLWDVRCTGTQIGDEYMQRSIHEIMDGHCLARDSTKKNKRRQSHSYSSQSIVSVKYLKHDQNLLVSAGASDGLVKYWDIRSRGHNSVECSTLPYNPTGRVYGFVSMILNPDGSKIYAASKDNTIHEYNTLNLESPPSRTFSSASLSLDNFYIKTTIAPNGMTLACGGGGSVPSVHLFDLSKGGDTRPPIVLKGHENDVSAVDWCKTDFDQLASCSDDCVVRVWNVRHVSTNVEFETGMIQEEMTVLKHYVGHAERGILRADVQPRRQPVPAKKVPVKRNEPVLQDAPESRNISPETVVQSPKSTPAQNTISQSPHSAQHSPSLPSMTHSRERTLMADNLESSCANSPSKTGCVGGGDCSKKVLSASAGTTPAKKSSASTVSKARRSLQTSPIQTVLGKYFSTKPKLNLQPTDTSLTAGGANENNRSDSSSSAAFETREVEPSDKKKENPVVALDPRLMPPTDESNTQETVHEKNSTINVVDSLKPINDSSSSLSCSTTSSLTATKPAVFAQPQASTKRTFGILNNSASNLQQQQPAKEIPATTATSAGVPMSRNSSNRSVLRQVGTAGSSRSSTPANRRLSGFKRTFSDSGCNSGENTPAVELGRQTLMFQSCGGVGESAVTFACRQNVSVSLVTEASTATTKNKRVKVTESLQETAARKEETLAGSRIPGVEPVSSEDLIAFLDDAILGTDSPRRVSRSSSTVVAAMTRTTSVTDAVNVTFGIEKSSSHGKQFDGALASATGFGTCGCGCPMIDADTCECVKYTSTVLQGSSAREKGCSGGENVVTFDCLDLGEAKENACPYHYSKSGL